MHLFGNRSSTTRHRRTSTLSVACGHHHRLTFEALEPRYCLSASIPALESLPGADHTIFLDFDGHLTEGTSWNSYWNTSSIDSPAYDSNGDPLNFSASEIAEIENVWQRVAEDFIPFDVNVTTVDPGIAALEKTGSGDSQWGVRAIITQDTVGSGFGGIAYVGSFESSADLPVFVFTTTAKRIAEATSHEVGHSLYLSHDGTSSATYYTGHGSGETSWAPIMGVGYGKNVTQWDRGEYYDASESDISGNYGLGRDDLQIITSNNGFRYRSDDHSDATNSATSLNSGGSSLTGSGIIETTNDVDVFSIDTAAGSITLNIDPAPIGPNLDVRAELYDAGGNLLAMSNPANSLSATIEAPVAAGRYYLKVTGVGAGDPTSSSPTGYTDYASLGQYSISGTVGVAANTDYLAIAASDASKLEGDSGSTEFTFTVTRSGDLSLATSVDYSVAGSGASPATADDLVGGALPTGNIAFVAGQSSQVISVFVRGDTLTEQDEQFSVALASATGATQISVASAVGTILTDDLPPTLSIAATDANRQEGTGDTSTPFTFTLTRSGNTDGTSTVRYEVRGVGGKNAASSADFEAGAYPSGIVTFAAGESSKQIVLSVTADAERERDERFRVTLTEATGAAIATSTADGTIVNDDGNGGGSGSKGGGNGNGRSGQKKTEAAPLIAFDSLEFFGEPISSIYGTGGVLEAAQRLNLERSPVSNLRFDSTGKSQAIIGRVAADSVYESVGTRHVRELPRTESVWAHRFSATTEPEAPAEATSVEQAFEEGFDWLENPFSVG